MKENNLTKILIPIIAVVVIVESVILMSNLSKDKSNVVTDNVVTPTEEVEKVETPVADFVFATNTKEMKVGKSYEVVLNLIGKKDLTLDAIEAYVKYNPELVTVTKLVGGSTLPKANLSKIDIKTGLVSSIFFIDVGKNYSVKTNEINKVISFTVTPKKEGLIDMELITSSEDKESVTMIVETITSKPLAFSSNKLEINATK
jgi:hypothetical protein